MEVKQRKSYNDCIHNKRKSRCIECMGSEICIHKKLKSRCIECGGSELCFHNKLRPFCKECGGSHFCEHGKRKSRCKICKGSQICIHNINKICCKECNSDSFCEHNLKKSRCIKCHGKDICAHNKLKYFCLDCDYKTKLCVNCKLVYKLKKYNNHCLRCYIYLFPDKPVCRNYKTKETSVAEFVTNNYSNFTWRLDKKIEDGCSKRRPDLICDLGYQVLIIEIDENMHEGYDCSCENKRIMQLSQDVGHRPIVLIRFNPDSYINQNGEKIASCWGTTPKTGIIKLKNNKQNEWNERLDSLKQQIDYWSNPKNKTEKTIETINLFYNCNV